MNNLFATYIGRKSNPIYTKQLYSIKRVATGPPYESKEKKKKMVTVVLSIPVSNTSCESVFSMMQQVFL